LVASRKGTHIAIEHDTERIAIDQGGVRFGAGGCEPGAQPTQVGYDTLVLPGAGCEHPSHRQPALLDSLRQEARSQVLPDAAMDVRAIDVVSVVSVGKDVGLQR